VQQKLDNIGSLTDPYLTEIDSLLQAKARLIEVTIYDLQSTIARKLPSQDSLSTSRVGELLNDKVDKLTPEQYTAKMNSINESLQSYQSKIADTEELAWVEHYSGQLDQMDGVVKQYQNKLLNLKELQALKGIVPGIWRLF